MRHLRSIAILVVTACGGARGLPPPGTGDQSVAAAVVLVCDAPARAQPEIRQGVGRSDAIAQHLTDGVGNDRVLTLVEGWKTNGINAGELDTLIEEAKLSEFPLRDTVGAH